MGNQPEQRDTQTENTAQAAFKPLRVLLIGKSRDHTDDHIRGIVEKAIGQIDWVCEFDISSAPTIEPASVCVALLNLDALSSDTAQIAELGSTVFQQIPTLVLGNSQQLQIALACMREGAKDFLILAESDVTTIRDAIERAQCEFAELRELRVSQARYRDVVEDQAELICRFLPDTTLTFVNNAYAAYFKSEPANLVGTLFLHLIPESDREAVQQKIASLTPQNPSASYDHRVLIGDDVHWQLWTDHAVFDSDGRLLEVQSIGRDITQRRSAEQEARDSQQRFESLYQNAPVMMHEVDGNGRILSVNQRWLDVLGYEEKDVIGKYSLLFLHEDSQELARHAIRTLKADDRLSDFSCQFVTTAGETIDVLLAAYVERDSDERVLRMVAVSIDVTAQRRFEQAVLKEKERLRVTLCSIGDAVITTNAKGDVAFLNPAAEKLTGWTSVEAMGKALIQVFHPTHEQSQQPLLDVASENEDTTNAALTYRRGVFTNRVGHEFAVQTSVASIELEAGLTLGSVIVFTDISEERKFMLEMEHHATHDALTGLVNRREFDRLLTELVNQSQDTEEQHALCFLDLDRFKQVNDTCGHAAGDELLRQITVLFKRATRHSDTLARLGGDEFAVLLRHCDVDQALIKANELCRCIENYTFEHDNQTFKVGVSIGISLITTDTKDRDGVLTAADSACYAAKNAGRGRIHVSAG